MEKKAIKSGLLSHITKISGERRSADQEIRMWESGGQEIRKDCPDNLINTSW